MNANINEPIRHHYIPQFILRNFTSDNKINYWNIEKNKIQLRNPKSIFMVKDLYADEKNHPENIRIIEKKFANLEGEIADIFNKYILDKSEIVITREQNEKLRKFLFLLSFRAEYRNNNM